MSSPSPIIPSKRKRTTPGRISVEEYQKLPIYEHNFDVAFNPKDLPKEGFRFSDRTIGFLYAMRDSGKFKRNKFIELQMVSHESFIYPGFLGNGEACIGTDGQVASVRMRDSKIVHLSGERDAKGAKDGASTLTLGPYIVNPPVGDETKAMPRLREWGLSVYAGTINAFQYTKPVQVGSLLVRKVNSGSERSNSSRSGDPAVCLPATPNFFEVDLGSGRDTR